MRTWLVRTVEKIGSGHVGCLMLAESRLTKALFSSKNFQDSPSHQIFGRMHGALNIDQNKN